MIYIHNGTKPVERFDMPHCSVTVEEQPWVRVYVAGVAEDPSHRAYERWEDAQYDPHAGGAVLRFAINYGAV